MSEWKTLTLAEVSDIKISNVDKKSIAGERTVLLCNYMDVYSNEYITRDLDFMEATASAVESEKFKVVNGDVLITKDSETPYDIGIPSAVVDHIEGLVCGYHLALIKPAPSIIDSVFLSKQLARAETARYFSRYAAGSTRYGLSNKAITNVAVKLPSLKNQKRIACILQTIDRAIEKTEALNDKYQQIKAGLMHDLFTRGIGPDGQLRPPREQAPELYKETPIGWIPKEWELVELGNVADLVVGYAFKSEWFRDEGIKLLRGENVGYGRADWSDTRCLSPTKAARYQEYLLNDHDVVIGMDRTFTKSGVKITVLENSDCPSLLVQRVGKFVPLDCKKCFLRWLVVSPVYIQRLINQQKGMDIPHLSKSEILEPIVPIPSNNEQQAIASLLDSIERLLDSWQLNYEKLQKQKSGLMHDLLTGKVPVQVEPEDEPEAAHV